MSFLKLKNYTRKTSIRLLFSRVLTHENSIDNIFLCSSTNVQIKISFYAFVKLLKLYKLKGFFFDSSYSMSNISKKIILILWIQITFMKNLFIYFRL